MSLLGFQQALAALVASPRLCLDVRRDASGVLARFDLDARERDRLAAIVWQRGMSTNCSLYRSNRVTPLYTHLPLTCALLDGRLIGELELFWQQRDETDLQFQPEVALFAEFLRERARAGHLEMPSLQAVLALELAINELLFLPRRRLSEEHGIPIPGELRRHPLMRLVVFSEEPARLLAALAARRPVPDDLAAGEYFVVVSATADEIDVEQVDEQFGRALERLDAAAPVGQAQA